MTTYKRRTWIPSYFSKWTRLTLSALMSHDAVSSRLRIDQLSNVSFLSPSQLHNITSLYYGWAWEVENANVVVCFFVSFYIWGLLYTPPWRPVVQGAAYTLVDQLSEDIPFDLFQFPVSCWDQEEEKRQGQLKEKIYGSQVTKKKRRRRRKWCRLLATCCYCVLLELLLLLDTLSSAQPGDWRKKQKHKRQEDTTLFFNSKSMAVDW